MSSVRLMFFFQAEDGIRDIGVTGVQTCALPIWTGSVDLTADGLCRGRAPAGLKVKDRAIDWLKRELAGGPRKAADLYAAARSEERRVGEECRSRLAPYH